MFTLLRLLFLPAKVGVGTTRLGVKTGYRAGRILGYRRVLVFAAGVGLGLLIAPMTGRQARAKLLELWEARQGGGDLAERIRRELSQSPRTWHLPQPEVEVVGGRAILRGEVPHELGRLDLERTAAAVAGVANVDNLIAVSAAAGTNGHH